MDGNINTDKFIQFIKLAQEIHIQNYMGTELYKELQALIPTDIDLPANAKFKTLLVDYIQPMLIWFAQVDYFPFAAYQVRNGGVYKHTAENSVSVWYSRRFIDYMAFNQAQFPKYNQNTDSDIYPSQDATFNGWVL